MNTQTQQQIEFKRVDNDINGNPRYACHFFNLLTKEEKHKDYAPGETGINGASNSLDEQYKFALKRANKIGGRKFHNKQYGGGIVFQSFNIKQTEKDILELLQQAK